MRRAICLAALGAAWLAAGCGQKGPLYLPDKNTRAVTTPSAQPAPAAPPSASAPQPAPPSTTPTPPAPGKPGDKSDDSGTPK